MPDTHLQPSDAATRRPSRRRRGLPRKRAARRREAAAQHRAQTIDLIGSVLGSHAKGDRQAIAAAIGDAMVAAGPLLDAGRPELGHRHLVAGALVRLAVETDCDLPAMAPAVRSLHDEFGVDSLEVGFCALAHPLLLSLPLDAAIEAVCALLPVVGPMQKVSLWLREPERTADLLQPGWATAADEAAAVARRELMLEAAAAETGLRVARISCWRRPCAALVFLPEAGRAAECLAVAERAAALLGPAFERASLIEGNVARSEALLSCAERRLTRLGFDLHDGPLQDVAVLSGNLTDIRSRVAASVGDTPFGRDLLAKLEDAAAVAEFLDGELRDVATSLDGTGLARKHFDDVLAGVVRKFMGRCSTEVDIAIVGETTTLTESQKITLLRVIQESLANVREHSAAANVRISIDARGSHVEATIADDGCGFLVEERMLEAGRGGRMGLAGMVERVRLLGGACHITSRPGAGTQISLSITRWVASPAVAELEAAPAVSQAG
jgi:signal transduction histidine kinase